MGGALTALEPDADRGVLNVPGMNYSTLLRRSVDSDEYFKLPGIGLYANYPNRARAAAAAVADPAPLGPRRGQRLRAQPDHRPAAEHASARGAAAGGARRPPGGERHRRGRGADDRRHRSTTRRSSRAGTGRPTRSWASWRSTSRASAPRSRTAACSSTTTAARWASTAPAARARATPPNENVPPRPEWGFGGDPHGYPRAARPTGWHQEGSFLAGNGVPRCADAVRLLLLERLGRRHP